MDEQTPQFSDSPLPLDNSKLQLPSSCDPPGLSRPPEQLVWVVFGATGHIGRSIVRAALYHNDLVCAVGQSYEDTLSSIVPQTVSPTSPSLPSTDHNILPLLCDVRLRDTVDMVLQRSIQYWGRIDIIVNCTGYGIIGAVEDQDEYDIRNQFEVNFWGTLNIVQLSLQYFREGSERGDTGTNSQDVRECQEGRTKRKRGGRYLIFSSTSGALGVPGLGPYCATKYAVEGLVESMVYEVDAFDIKFTLVEPGFVRRDEDEPTTFAPSSAANNKEIGNRHNGTTVHAKANSDPSAHSNPNSAPNPLPSFGHFFIKPPSATYSSPNAPAGHAKRMLHYIGERQPTSCKKVAEIVWQLGHCGSPPMRLCLGGFAVETSRERLRGVIEEVDEWKWLNFSGEEDGRVGKQGIKEEDGGMDVNDGEEEGEHG